MDSISPVKVLLSSSTQRLELNGSKFVVDTPASLNMISDVWSSLQEIDPEFDLGPFDKVKRTKVNHS